MTTAEKTVNGSARVAPSQEAPPSVLAPPGLVSLLVPCVGQLEYTKLCVPSLLRHTCEPFEIIFLDVGSLDGTADYIAGVAAAARVRVELAHTPTDLGIKDAVAEAVALARGEFLALVNNDVVVTEHWLDQLLALAALSQAIGLVGPMSNYAAPPQLVESVPYRSGPRKGAARRDGQPLVDAAAVNAFAKEFRDERRGGWVEADRLGGFCLLVRRAVLKKIEQSCSMRDWGDLGLFDTDMLSAKARQAGYTLACCRDLFVHHFGTRTFAHGAPQSEEICR